MASLKQTHNTLTFPINQYIMRHSGAMASAPDSKWSDLGLTELWLGSLHGRHFTLIVPLCTQEYKWAPMNCWSNLTEC